MKNKTGKPALLVRPNGSSGRTGRYILYAFGEIILVVIGILIALQINNWNEERKAADKSEVLLKQVHKELIFNINKASKVIEQYRRKNNIVYDVTHRKVTNEYYKNKGIFAFIVLDQEAVEITDDAFKNLIDNQNNFNDNQEAILLKLKELYSTNKKRVDLTDEISTNLVLDYYKKFKNEKKWFFDLILTGELNDEVINYLLTDSIYLNMVANFQILNLTNHKRYTKEFRHNALDAYSELSDYLKIEKDSSLIKNVNAYDHYLGAYTNNIFSHVIKKQNGKLVRISFRNSDSTKRFTFNFYPDSKTSFTINNYLFGELSYNENNEVIGFTASNGNHRTEFKKIN